MTNQSGGLSLIRIVRIARSHFREGQWLSKKHKFEELTLSILFFGVGTICSRLLEMIKGALGEWGGRAQGGRRSWAQQTKKDHLFGESQHTNYQQQTTHVAHAPAKGTGMGLGGR